MKLPTYIIAVSTFIYFFTCSTSAIGQEKLTLKSFNKTTIQLGIFSDIDNTELWGRTYDINKSSINKIALGKLAFANENVSQVLLELSYYKDEFDITGDTPFMGSQIERSIAIIELEYFKSLTNRETFSNNFHFGYVINGYVQLEQNIPFSTNNFLITKQSLNIAPGIKAIYVRQIKNDLSFIISSDLYPIVGSIEREENLDPNIFVESQTSITIGNFQLLRQRFGIDFGFIF